MSGVGPISAAIPPQTLSGFADRLRQKAAHTPQELAEIKQLQKTDRLVRAHEQAHLNAAGPYAIGGASYTYATGPDGQRYAVAGEVPIDTSPIPGDPEGTIRKARTIQAAANAPAEPSGQDRAVAAEAAQMEARAQMELLEKFQEVEDPLPGSLLDLFA